MMAVNAPSLERHRDAVERSDHVVAVAVDLDGVDGSGRGGGDAVGRDVGSGEAGHGSIIARPERAVGHRIGPGPDRGATVGAEARLPYAERRMSVCPSCAAPYPDGARFCPSCGHGLGAAGVRSGASSPCCSRTWWASRRQAERMDPEQVKSLVDGLFAAPGRRTSPASADGSTRSSATPSWPCSVRPSPTRTMPSGRCEHRCGCNDPSSSRSPIWTCRIRMRIGINTGEVLVGALRAGWRLHRHGRCREHRVPPADRGAARRRAGRPGHPRRHGRGHRLRVRR